MDRYQNIGKINRSLSQWHISHYERISRKGEFFCKTAFDRTLHGRAATQLRWGGILHADHFWLQRRKKCSNRSTDTRDIAKTKVTQSGWFLDHEVCSHGHRTHKLTTKNVQNTPQIQPLMLTMYASIYLFIMPRPLGGALCDAFVWRLSDVWRLSVAYIGNNSRTERPRKTKIGTEVAHVTRDSDTTFKVKRSKVKVTWSISP